MAILHVREGMLHTVIATKVPMRDLLVEAPEVAIEVAMVANLETIDPEEAPEVVPAVETLAERARHTPEHLEPQLEVQQLVMPLTDTTIDICFF